MGRIVDRSAQVVAGLVLLVPGLFLLLLSVVFVVGGALDPRSRTELWWAVPSAFVTAHIVFWGGRLLLGRPRADGGLLSPRWLFAFGILLFSFPLVSLATGAYRSVGIPVWFVLALAILSPFAVYGLSVMVARRRKLSGSTNERTRRDP